MVTDMRYIYIYEYIYASPVHSVIRRPSISQDSQSDIVDRTESFHDYSDKTNEVMDNYCIFLQPNFPIEKYAAAPVSVYESGRYDAATVLVIEFIPC